MGTAMQASFGTKEQPMVQALLWPDTREGNRDTPCASLVVYLYRKQRLKIRIGFCEAKQRMGVMAFSPDKSGRRAGQIPGRGISI